MPGEAFPPTAFLRAQKNCGAHKSLALDPHRSGREEGTAAPAAGQMCLGSRPSEGTWGRRGGVRGEAAGKQKLRQLALPSVPPPRGASSCHGLDTKHTAPKAAKEESDLLHTWLDSLVTSGTDGNPPFFFCSFFFKLGFKTQERHLQSFWAVERKQHQASHLSKEKGDKYSQGCCWLHGGGGIQVGCSDPS